MYKKAWQTIIDAEHILLVSHVNPDGDTLGCVLAMYDALKRSNKKVSLYNATKVLPKIYDFLPNINKIKDKPPARFDVVVSCDCGSFDRLKIDQGDYTLINIDHHKTSEYFGDMNLVNVSHSSAGLVVYDLLLKNGIKISKDCATCLYTAMAEDTGFFSYGNLNEFTFDAASKLVSLGASASFIAGSLKSRQSLAKVRLLAYILNNFELHFDAQIAFIYIDKEVLAQTGARRYDTKNIINILRDMATVKVAVMVLEEKHGGFKVSMRSKENVDISAVATKFGGGGHKNSAGFENKDDSFLDLKAMILKRIMEYDK
ncbi:MAG: bifunctional oligoribonuclease/PAP phosphatase NrnA [Sulfurospirillaceae bacterium]|nr:bifunctional oligoribonuclease/PAP phosphatase NrnA [Sulfurospirillaceae bacterium]